ncbi:MAG: hypothetical protein JO296_18790 [Pseudonocardiales bacterium]|jgi:hypothetical protein|nr:hypothetical protein [Pseudonocardiales bacterium]MBV9652167.1 hypothetical protein [Pseudonocardiales bacterium]
MPEALSFIEIERQHLELLPARTVMSMFMADGTAGNKGTTGGSGNTESAPSTTTTDPMSQQLAGVMQIFAKLPIVGKLAGQ